MITIHEITRTSTKAHEGGAVLLVLFLGHACNFGDRNGFLVDASGFFSSLLEETDYLATSTKETASERAGPTSIPNNALLS